MEITRHFTATTVIVYKDKVLLHLHKKLKIWLPVGGHIDRDELPEETATKEIFEESGLEVSFWDPDTNMDFKNAKRLLRPIHLILEDINPYHQHIDFIYYAKAKNNKLQPQDNESLKIKWFRKEDLQKLEDLPENVRVLCFDALEKLSK